MIMGLPQPVRHRIGGKLARLGCNDSWGCALWKYDDGIFDRHLHVTFALGVRVRLKAFPDTLGTKHPNAK
jgi:hypothetical protein